MPYKRGNYYYVDIRPQAYPNRIGPLSTRQTNKRRAEQIEAALRELADTGRHEILDAVVEGQITPVEVFAAYRKDSLDSLLHASEEPLSEAVERFLDQHPKGRDNYDAAMRRLLNVAPSDATVEWLTDPDNLQRMIRVYREEDLAAATERRQMNGVSMLIRHVFDDATRDGVWEDLSIRSDENRRTRWLDQGEIEDLRQATPEDWWVFICLLISTGMRTGEARALRRRDVDLDSNAVIVREGKSQQARRRVPLTGEARELLSDWIDDLDLQGGERLFQDLNQGRLSYAWTKIREAAGLEDVRLHDLRHTYAVHAAKAGMPLVALKHRLGHANIDQTMRYAVYSPAETAHHNGALQRMQVGT